MRVLICPDKFKGTLSAAEAADAIRDGVLRAAPEAEIVIVPLADGGEGTVAAAVHAGAELRTTRVHGPLGDEVDAEWAVLPDGTAVIESSAASGLRLVAPTPQSAAASSTVGTGELIRAALDAGSRTVVLGLGGVATTDGGAGILTALGARVLDASREALPPGGAALSRAAELDLTNLHPAVTGLRVILACDVDSPLTGPTGAAAVFAPQKGADADTVAVLEEALVTWRRVVEAATGASVDVPGAGAAGGAAAGVLALGGAEFRSGFDTVAELVGLPELVRGADAVITGEGSLDEQSLAGKGPIGVARLARSLGVPALAVAGRITVSPGELTAEGVVHAVSLVECAGSIEAAFADSARHAADSAERAFSRWLASR